MKRDGDEAPISASQIDRKPEQTTSAAELGEKEFQPNSTSAGSPLHCDGTKEELRRAETEPPIVGDSSHQVNKRY
ncbi:hypothetical protein SDJN03_28337, partial [Cucurbita argyrosperma subsp. sororia]